MGLRDAKQEIRTRMRAMRDALPAKKRALLSVLANQQIQNAASSMGICCVGLYRAMGSEINLGPLARAWERQGVRLAVPVTLTGHRLAFVEVTAAELDPEADQGEETPRLEAFLVRPWQPLPEPPRSHPLVAPEELDLLLVPGLAFDIRGGRLGYGGGYYDRYLAQTGPLVPRWGVCFEEQLLNRIPTDSFDVGMNAVATPLRTIATLP